ncbi:MAG: gamma-glutamyl kinase [Rhodobacteraceae bacterium]|nr:gamma-glutamyl kinase [Paracoccaceae bacterium]
MAQRLVFLSVPKTGTTAYEAVLAPHADIVVSNPPELKHAPIYRYNRFFRPMFEKVCGLEMETLAVVREPVDWLGSWYRYRQRPFLAGHPNGTHDLSFDAFVAAYLMDDRPGFANVGSQARFLEPRRNGLRATYLFRYDDQAGLQRFLEARLSVPVRPRRLNVSPQSRQVLSDDLRARLRRECSAEFELYESIAASS